MLEPLTMVFKQLTSLENSLILEELMLSLLFQLLVDFRTQMIYSFFVGQTTLVDIYTKKILLECGDTFSTPFVILRN